LTRTITDGSRRAQPFRDDILGGDPGAAGSAQPQITVLVVAPKAVTTSDTVKVTSNTFDPGLQDNRATVEATVK
jgi:hypothetical protein